MSTESVPIAGEAKPAVQGDLNTIGLQNGDANVVDSGADDLLSRKRKREEGSPPLRSDPPDHRERRKGTAPIKAEFLVDAVSGHLTGQTDAADDDAAEAFHHEDRRQTDRREGKPRQKNQGQNTARKFGKSKDEVGLCQSRAYAPELSPGVCPYGEKCRFEHDLRKYLKEHKREDLTTFGGVCPVWDAKGTCNAGWKCRFVGSHMKERDVANGRKELILVEDEARKAISGSTGSSFTESGVINVVSTGDKLQLAKRKYKTARADKYTEWIEKSSRELEKSLHAGHDAADDDNGPSANNLKVDTDPDMKDRRAAYTEPPFLPSEKRRIYFGAETPVLAPLTTQGNLPFRRLCTDLGAQFTYSEMAMSMSLLQGNKSEWALLKAHESEAASPSVNPKTIVQDYDPSKDLKFGAQIAGNKPWQVLKSTEVLTALCPHLRVIDLNCGCPIDLVFREGSGSALMDHQSKLEKMLRGMNAVSQEVPITVKIRMGTRDSKPNAIKLAERLVLGGHEAHELGLGAPGVAAITLHGRSRQQRYTRSADWEYIADCAALIKRLNAKSDTLADTIREPDARTQPPGGNSKVYFLGNGDCYSHEHYNSHLEHAGVDSVMIARGALMKPWLFEEIVAGQYLDKSATERLALVEKFAKFGLEAWGSDEMGVGTTRRFLLEWLSFACRYVPIGLLEVLPPSIQDRPPAWRGRNELETLLGSDNFKDWIKIRQAMTSESLGWRSRLTTFDDSEMFLGPAHKDFRFEPKHKSNSYEAEG